MSKVSYKQIETKSDGKRGEIWIACPQCGPKRQRPSDADEKTLHCWLTDNLVSYRCMNRYCKIGDTVFKEKGNPNG